MAGSNARLEVSGAGKTEAGLVQYNEEVNKLGDDLRELYETIRVNVDEEEQWKVFDFVEDSFWKNWKSVTISMILTVTIYICLTNMMWQQRSWML